MGLKISEIVAALSKVQSAIGDAPVVFKELESDAETILRGFDLALSPTADATSSKVIISHSAATDADVEPAAPVEQTNAATDQAADPANPIT